jgi:type II secretory pathway pseudopilin PulG
MRARFALVILAGGALLAACSSGPRPGTAGSTATTTPSVVRSSPTGQDIAAQSNLQTALAAARTYYNMNNQYSGVVDGFGGIDTGLSSVAGGTASNGPHLVSMDAVSGSLLLIAAWAPEVQDCWAIVTSASPNSIDGQTAFVGVLYVETPRSQEPACKASTYDRKGVVAGSSTSTASFAAAASETTG